MSEDTKIEKTVTTEKLLYDQLSLMQKQLRLTRILAAAAVLAAAVILAAAVLTIPPAVQSLQRADQLLADLQKAELAETVGNINSLAKGSQEEIDKTMEKLNQLDIESLNKAIQNLESAARPLAGLFGN